MCIAAAADKGGAAPIPTRADEDDVRLEALRGRPHNLLEHQPHRLPTCTTTKLCADERAGGMTVPGKAACAHAAETYRAA